MIRAVTFDFGQTLVDSADAFRDAEKRMQRRIYEDMGLTSWPEFLGNYRTIRSQFHEKSNVSRQAMWQEVYRYYCRRCHDALLEAWEREYWDTVKAGTTPFPEAEAVLEQLAARYLLALITNTQGQPGPAAHRFNSFPQLKRLFDVVVVAGEEGIPPKPDARPFRVCLERMGVEPEEATYVGDDWRIDVCGARDAGMYPVWLKHRLVDRRWPDVRDTAPVIVDLERLLDIVPVI